LLQLIKLDIIQIWTAVECNGAIYCTVVTSYCLRPKLLLKPSCGWCYHSAINRTSARNKQSIFVLLSHHQKCTLIGENNGLYFSWIVDRNSKNTSQFQLVSGSPIHLSAYFSLWRIHGVQWMTFLWHFSSYLTVSNGSKYSLHRHPLALWKPTSSAIW